MYAVRRPALRIRQPIRILIRQDFKPGSTTENHAMWGASENKGGTLRRIKCKYCGYPLLPEERSWRNVRKMLYAFYYGIVQR